MNCIGLFIQSWFVVLSTTKTLEIQNVNIYSYCYIFIKINSYLFTDIGWTYHINPLNITKYMFNEELTGYMHQIIENWKHVLTLVHLCTQWSKNISKQNWNLFYQKVMNIEYIDKQCFYYWYIYDRSIWKETWIFI